ncbi:MAG: response regulator transcription factor [Sphingobacteriales bacterium]|nr:MAG: response regulator transcription factor [Sphingobacteriales bacterium]
MKTSIKIALADDHTLFRKALAEMIGSMDSFEVLFDAADGGEMILRLRESTILPDICILDLGMPKMDGYDTLKYIRKNWPDIKVLVISIYKNEFTILKVFKAGANGYMTKDADPQELKKALLSIHYTGYFDNTHTVCRSRDTDARSKLMITDGESEFLRLCCTDLTYQQIAEYMNVSIHTVEGYRDVMYQKLKVNSRIGLAIQALLKGIITVQE